MKLLLLTAIILALVSSTISCIPTPSLAPAPTPTPTPTPAPTPIPLPEAPSTQQQESTIEPIPTPESEIQVQQPVPPPSKPKMIKEWSGNGGKTTEPFTVTNKPRVISWANNPTASWGTGYLGIHVHDADYPDSRTIALVANVT